MGFIEYILTSTACLSFCFLFYRLTFRNNNNFKQLRLFLLASILVSLLLPLNDMDIHLNTFVNHNVIISFHISTQRGEYVRVEMSDSESFSEGQIKLINVLKNGEHLWIEDIIARGPDGKEMELNACRFTIEGES